MKKIFIRENLLILLIVALIGHNVYLQFQIEEAIDAAEDASYYAEEAADYAEEAADYAEDAADYAEDAADNAFGNECYSCP